MCHLTVGVISEGLTGKDCNLLAQCVGTWLRLKMFITLIYVCTGPESLVWSPRLYTATGNRNGPCHRNHVLNHLWVLLKCHSIMRSYSLPPKSSFLLCGDSHSYCWMNKSTLRFTGGTEPSFTFSCIFSLFQYYFNTLLMTIQFMMIGFTECGSGREHCSSLLSIVVLTRESQGWYY